MHDAPQFISDECPSGEEWLSSRESCVMCERGYYRTFGVDYWCVACPDGLGTKDPGATSRELCRGGCIMLVYKQMRCVACISDLVRCVHTRDILQRWPMHMVCSRDFQTGLIAFHRMHGLSRGLHYVTPGEHERN